MNQAIIIATKNSIKLVHNPNKTVRNVLGSNLDGFC